MKKKSLLGILAVLMVFALALTGCGQQGEQNAGATGSESQNGTTVDDDKNEGVITAEPEEPAAGEADNRKPEMRDGMYVYEVLGEEFLCETNVWDYIDEDAKTFDFIAMERFLGLSARDGNYCLGDYVLNPPYFHADNIAEARFNIMEYIDSSHTKVDSEKERVYIVRYSPSSSASWEYIIKGDNNYRLTLDLIILMTYGSERAKISLDSSPFGEHLANYYNEQTLIYELP